MAQHESDQNPLHQSTHAMVGAGTPAGVPAVTLPSGANMIAHGVHVSPPLLRQGVDQSALFNALRRRWLLASFLGLLFGVSAAATLWVMFPEYNQATALLRVMFEKPTVLDRIEHGGETRNYEIFQATQLAMLNSAFVLNSALTSPEIANLPIIKNQDDELRWLRENLNAQFEQRNSEILKISLATDLPEAELKSIVDAVTAAYMREAVFKDRRLALQTRDLLQNSFQRVSDELDRKQDDYWAAAKELGVSDSEENKIRSQILLGDLRMNQSQQMKYQEQLMEVYTENELVKAQARDPLLMEQMASSQVNEDPMIQQLQMRMMGIDAQIVERQSMVKRGSGKFLESLLKQKRDLQQQLNQRQQELTTSIMAQIESEPNLYLRASKGKLKVMQQMLGRQIALLQREEQEIMNSLGKLTEESTELVKMSSEVEQLRELHNSMDSKLRMWTIELEAPDRVTVLQEADTSEGINRFQRWLIATSGGLLALVLCCFVTGYLEFRNRRLDGPSQVDEGLGIRVIGTLPALSHRRMAREGDPVLATLLDSIDSVRTTLMHDAASTSRRVVLVTSATQNEGRTTVASQLAASLARAGRRTLLIDADLRRPALHTLFDLPLEAGLCEVLRAESDVADTIHPTHAEGLWVMTAGYCDTEAIQAMANDQLQPIFEKVRGDYDFVIVDGAPVLGLADSLLVGQHCDGAVLSVLRDVSQTPKIHQAAEALRGVGIRLIGAVVNGVASKSNVRVNRLHLAPPRETPSEMPETSGTPA